jgi:pleiotropic regulator 1
MVQRRAPQKVPVPQWHPKWELGVVLSGHLGWVRSISFDPSNQWFATGSMDRTIKIWDFPKSVLGDKDCLKLTLTGHISGVRGLAVSDRHPYLFSGILKILSFIHDVRVCYNICIVVLD